MVTVKCSLNRGDVVVMSGTTGPKMTVEFIDHDVKVKWFDKYDVLHENKFPKDLLRKVIA